MARVVMLTSVVLATVLILLCSQVHAQSALEDIPASGFDETKDDTLFDQEPEEENRNEVKFKRPDDDFNICNFYPHGEINIKL